MITPEVSSQLNKLSTTITDIQPEAISSLKSRLSSIRPFSDFFAKDRFSLPSDFNTFKTRASFNIIYFQNNYLLISVIVVAYFLITNLWLLVSGIFFFGGFKLVASKPDGITILEQKYSQAQLWTVYFVLSFLLFWLSGITSTLIYVFAVCGLFCLGHAGCLDKPIEAEYESMPDYGDEQV
ncbi:hypothetical protein HDV04_001160 [Boothiomyces sp. JEL0838]|nr:hypothetical protein HDV04_001160 [Boothiomyces sp. JEL0838]